jgi:hypothetical protein
MGILVAMARMTSFRFTVVDDAALNATFARHAGATRFAYNQCLRAVKGALEAKSTNPAVKRAMGVLPLLPHLVFDYRTFTLRLREWHMGEPDSGLSKLTGLAARIDSRGGRLRLSCWSRTSVSREPRRHRRFWTTRWRVNDGQDAPHLDSR